MLSRAETVLRNSARPYLYIVIASLLLAGYAEYLRHYLGVGFPLIFGQAPDVYVAGIGILLAAGAWLLYRGSRTSEPLLVVFFVLLIITWLMHWLLSRFHGDAFTYAVLFYIPVLIALWWKTPARSDLMAGLVFLSWLITLILVSTRFFEFLGIIPMLDVGTFFVTFERENYWLPLAGTLGPESRWHGPFGHAAKTGAAAAFLLVLAFGYKGRSRWVFGTVAVLTLLMVSSRGALIAAGFGVALVLIFGENFITRHIRRAWLLAGLGVIGAIGLAGVLIRNPSLTGRTTYWSLALEVWQTSPISGVGIGGMQASELAIAGTNAHNVVLDGLVKFGLLGTIPILAIFVVATILAIKSTRLGVVLPMGLLGTYLILGLAEADTEWMRITQPWLWLVLAVLLAGRVVQDQSPHPLPLSSGEWSGSRS